MLSILNTFKVLILEKVQVLSRDNYHLDNFAVMTNFVPEKFSRESKVVTYTFHCLANKPSMLICRPT